MGQELLSQWLGEHHHLDSPLDQQHDKPSGDHDGEDAKQPLLANQDGATSSEANVQLMGKELIVPQPVHITLLQQYLVWSIMGMFFLGCRKRRGGVFFVPLFCFVLLTQSIICAAVKNEDVQLYVNLVLGVLEIIF